MLCALHKSNQIKVKVLKISSARVKIHQILVIFETKNQLFSNFALLFNVMRHNSSIPFLSEILYKFGEISDEQSKI